jgi:hypothetical protein
LSGAILAIRLQGVTRSGRAKKRAQDFPNGAQGGSGNHNARPQRVRNNAILA